MSNNLDLQQVSENQTLKEVSINTAIGQLDAALTEAFVADVSAGNVLLTNAQYRRNICVNITGATTGGRTVTLPVIKKLMVFAADITNTQTVDIVRGTSTETLSPGSTVIVYTDGTANGLLIVSTSSAGAARPYDVGTFCVGKPDTSELLLRFNFVRNVDLPANLTGSRVTASVAATAQTDFDVQLNGASIGTVRFAAAGTVATFVGFSATTIAPNDVFSIVAPASQDATLANISFTFAGTQV